MRWRKEQLNAIKRMLEENEDLIVDTIKKDLGRPRYVLSSYLRKHLKSSRFESVLLETQILLSDVNHFLDSIDSLVKPQQVYMHLIVLSNYLNRHRSPRH